MSIAMTPSAQVVRRKSKCVAKDIKKKKIPLFLNIHFRDGCISMTGDSLPPFLIVLMSEEV